MMYCLATILMSNRQTDYKETDTTLYHRHTVRLWYGHKKPHKERVTLVVMEEVVKAVAAGSR